MSSARNTHASGCGGARRVATSNRNRCATHEVPTARSSRSTWRSATSDVIDARAPRLRAPLHFRGDDSIRSEATKRVSDVTVTDDDAALCREILTICRRREGHERTDAHVRPFADDPNSALVANVHSKMRRL